MFVVLFYDQEPGLNIRILGILVAVLTYFNTEKKIQNPNFFIQFWQPAFLKQYCFLLGMVILPFFNFHFAFYWFHFQNKELKSILVIPVLQLIL